MSIPSTLVKFIRSGVSRKLSGNAVLKLFRQQGFKLRTQTFYDTWRTYLKVPKISKALRFVTNNRRISNVSFLNSGELQSKKYRWVVELKGTRGDSGEPYTFYTSVISNQNRLVGNVKEKAMSRVEGSLSSYGHTIESVAITSAFVR